MKAKYVLMFNLSTVLYLQCMHYQVHVFSILHTWSGTNRVTHRIPASILSSFSSKIQSINQSINQSIKFNVTCRAAGPWGPM